MGGAGDGSDDGSRVSLTRTFPTQESEIFGIIAKRQS